MERVINYLVVNDVIDADDIHIYRYGLNQLAFLALHLLTYAMIAFLLGEMKQLLVFLVLFIPLRMFAGGYHAKTRMECYRLSVTIVFAVLTVLKQVALDLQIWIILILLSYSIIFLLSPRESINKPLSKIERKKYRSRSMILLNGECLIMGLSFYFGRCHFFHCAILALVVVALLLVFDCILQG